MNYLVKLIVRFKNSKTNEAFAIQAVLENLDIKDVDLNCAKYYELNIKADNESEAIKKAELVANKVLVNPIIEDFELQEVFQCESV